MRIPSEWGNVLSEVQGVFPGAIIAGGALRDLFLGKEVKDVDIFIPIKSRDIEDEHISDVYSLFPEAEPHPSHTYGVKSSPEDEERDLFAIFKMERNGIKYDLIFGTPQSCDMNNFDINICQIIFNGSDLIVSPFFIEAVRDRHIRVLNINRTDRNRARLERIASKYPEYTTEDK